MQTESLGDLIVFNGSSAARIPLRDKLAFGRGADAEIRINDPSVSRRHAIIEQRATGFGIRDLGSQSGVRVNGYLFEQHELVFGDLVSIGAAHFRFDGGALVAVDSAPGGRIDSVKVTRMAGNRAILNEVSLRVDPCQFVGILGTSGAGKSTLLDALSGLREPTSGQVLLNGASVYQQDSQTSCGYVPQDDIVHHDLTVEQALMFSAALRLPGSIPQYEIQKLVQQTMKQLRLTERAGVKVGSLSGGQRKRVSIGAELLAKPPVLFLDEPSSGLDPATEFKLMELLRELANTGCTIICTTHVMENVFLMDQVVVIMAGRLVYAGAPADAVSHFGIQRFTFLYDQLETKPSEEWQAAFEAKRAAQAQADAASAGWLPWRDVRDRPNYLQILLLRQWTLLSGEAKNLMLLAGQPLGIGLLVAWMAMGQADLKLFLAYLATFWFGCSNAAEDIVNEISIYRRERIIGLGRHDYLITKFGFMGAATSIQAIIFYCCICMTDMAGARLLQLLSLIATAWCAVGIGYATSALVKTTTQAVRVVPLILLPQIIFCGFVLNLDGGKRQIAAFIPSYSSQVMMSTSLLWGNTVQNYYPQQYNDESARYAQEHPDDPGSYHSNILRAYQTMNINGDLDKGNGAYDDAWPAFLAFFKLAVWTALSYFIAFFALKKRERT